MLRRPAGRSLGSLAREPLAGARGLGEERDSQPAVFLRAASGFLGTPVSTAVVPATMLLEQLWFQRGVSQPSEL